MKTVTVWGDANDLCTPRYLCEGVARDALKESGGELIQESLRLSDRFELRHDITIVRASVKTDGANFCGPWHYRQKEALDGIKALLNQQAVTVPDEDIQIVSTVLSVCRYEPMKFPVHTQFNLEFGKDGAPRYSVHLNLHPEKDGRLARGKVCFPTRAWKSVDNMPVVIDGIEKEKDSYCFVYGHVDPYSYVGREQVLELLLEQRENLSVGDLGDAQLVEFVDELRGSRWVVDLRCGSRGLYFVQKSADGKCSLFRCSDDLAWGLARKWEDLNIGARKQVLRLADTLVFDKGYPSYAHVEYALRMAEGCWTFAEPGVHKDDCGSLCYKGRKVSAEFSRVPLEDDTLDSVFAQAIDAELVHVWEDAVTRVRIFTIPKCDLIGLIEFTAIEFHSIISEVQRLNLHSIEMATELLQRGKLRFEGV